MLAPIAESAVASWITTSGSERITVAITALRSSTSSTTASAPSSRSAGSLSSEVVVATTS